MWWQGVFCTILAAVAGQSTTVLPCVNSPGDLPLNIYVAGCSQPPCQLVQLEDAVINIWFQAPRNMLEMRTNATAYLTLFGIVLAQPYDLEEQSFTCNFLLNTFCPVLQNEIVHYRLVMYIEPLFFVGTQATVEFSVVDEVGVPALCVRVPISIMAPNPSRSEDQLEHKDDELKSRETDLNSLPGIF